MKKIFICFSFLMFLFPFFSVSASAEELPPLNLSNGKNYFVIKANSNTFLFVSNGDFFMRNSETVSATDKGTIYMLQNNEWVFDNSPTSHDWVNFGGTVSHLYSNVDIYSNSSLTSVKFTKKPIPVPPLAVEGAVQKVELGAVLQVVKEVAPIVVLSMVSYLGLRKAWHFCLSQLKSS